jgi:phosphatidylethanolamine/phosphatidyl-N-methylethanolamine N-methyltransferase
MRFWDECGNFLRETRRHFRSTGAVLPSSRFLARALVSELRKPRGPVRILEVGPGTGSVTAEIVRYMLPWDRLDAVEISMHFIHVLQRRLDIEWRARRDRIELIHSPVEELPGEGVYDFIISGLPFNNFPVSLVREIFRAYTRLLKPGGTLSYFEYVFAREVQHAFVSRRERRRLYRIGRFVDGYVNAYQVRRQRILMNVPPAIVRHLRLRPRSLITTGIDSRRAVLV